MALKNKSCWAFKHLSLFSILDKLNYSYYNGGRLRTRLALFTFVFIVILIVMFVFFSRPSTYEPAGFSVPSQRVNTGKSAATTQKWDGIGKIADMIWE